MELIGCDFSSSPSRSKPIVIARGVMRGACVQLTEVDRLSSLQEFSGWLEQPRPWVGGFDLPFGLPRRLVEALGWPTQWQTCIAHFAALERSNVRATFKAFCDARPTGGKFAHRATDLPAGSSPSMKWVNPPVAYMLHAGVPLLLRAGVHLPGLMALPAGPPGRVALEAYPGLLARDALGRRSYKSDDAHKHTAERLIARKDLIHALETGRNRLALRLLLTHAQRDALASDPRGDLLDAAICLMQAAWGWQRHQSGHALFGLPPDLDPLEGWIIGADVPFSGE